MSSRLDKAPRGLPGPLGVVAQPPGPPPVPRRQHGELRPDLAAYADEPVPEELPERKEKVGGWYGYPSNLARIRAAWFHTQTTEDGYQSLSEMNEQVLLREAQALEDKYNGGEPFPSVPAGKVRHSRRT